MSTRPRALDLFCGAGGAAVGLHRAGFDVVGVDHVPQPRYPFEFHQANAMTFPLEGFDFVWASPPCQAYSRATAWTGDRSSHPDLIDPVRDRLLAAGVPYAIENVQEARYRLKLPILLCGTMFGLRVRRHRYFEVPGLPLQLMPDCDHKGSDYSHDHGGKQTESVYRNAMDCQWMTVHEARQAIPPAYSQFIAEQMMPAVLPADGRASHA